MREQLKAVVVLAGLVGFTGVVACGDNGIGETATGELSVGESVLEIPEMGPSSRSSSFSGDNALSLTNSGDELMEIRSISWVDQPSRVTAYTDEVVTSLTGDGCSSSDECPDDSVCLTQANECRATGFTETPREVRAGQTYVQSLVVAGSDEPVQCTTEIPDDVPEEVGDSYCGAIEVETSATNNQGPIADGNVTIYLSRGDGGGILDLPETVLEFTQAVPGVPQEMDFVIENSDAVPLEISSASFSTNSSWFSVDPPLNNHTIAGNSSDTFTLEMTPPEDLSDDSELEFSSSVSFESTSVGPTRTLLVDVTAGFGYVPLIEVDPPQLSFAEDSTQTFEVRNRGVSALPLNFMEIRPSGEVEDFYTVTYEGVDVIEDSSAIPNLQGTSDPDNPRVEEFTIEFDAPADVDTTIGTLRIHHQDQITGSPSEIDLFGDVVDVALGDLSPESVVFRSEGEGEVQEREFAVINRGTSPMTIDGTELEARSGDPDLSLFDSTDLEGETLGAGEIVVGTISYSGDTEISSDITLRIQSDDHVGSSDMLEMRARAQPISISTMELSLLPSFPDTATVDEAATLNVVDDTNQANLSAIEWTLLERPSGSETELEGDGAEALIWPDSAGTYRVSALVRDNSNREEQLTLTFEAE